MVDTSVLVLPFHSYGTLLDLANSTFVFEGVIAMVMASTLAGVSALHQMDILHGDIKPDNVLIQKFG